MDRNAPRIDASLSVPSYTGGPLVTIENSSFVYAADVGGFSTINVSIPTNPSVLRRDAIRNPDGARSRQLLYRLTFGPSGVVISNLAILGGLVLMKLSSPA